MAYLILSVVIESIERLSFRFESIPDASGLEIPGRFLVVDDIPDVFTRRYGSIPRGIFVRTCYEDLYDVATTHLKTPNDSSQNVLFTGVPGIGKSLFMIYFLCEFSMDDRFPDKKFAIQFASKEYGVYVPTATPNEYSYKKYDDYEKFKLKEYPLFVDILGEHQPEAHGKWTLIFSSPNPKRYKEVIKAAPAWMYTLPTWSEDELSVLNPDKERWFDRFVKCGGVPRIVLWVGPSGDPMRKFDDALKAKGATVANYFFKYGFGDVDPEKSYFLVHINPPISESGDGVMYGGTPVHTFASDYVFQKLAAMHGSSLIAEALGLFNAGGGVASLGAVSAGHLFEKICLWLAPIAGKSIRPELLGRSDFPLDRILLPQVQILPPKWKQLKNLVFDILYQPTISNLESGDAFCVVKMTGIWTLVVLQVTVAENHPIKANGLKVIYDAFPDNLRTLIQRKLLVFVTPPSGNLCDIQPYHDQKNHVMKDRIPPIVREFEQCVYRHSIVTPDNSTMSRQDESVEESQLSKRTRIEL
jgi:hypothetical protein